MVMKGRTEQMAVPLPDASAGIRPGCQPSVESGGQGCVRAEWLGSLNSSREDSSSYFMASLLTTALILFAQCTCHVALCYDRLFLGDTQLRH